MIILLLAIWVLSTAVKGSVHAVSRLRRHLGAAVAADATSPLRV